LVGPVGLFLLGQYASFLASVLLRRKPPTEPRDEVIEQGTSEDERSPRAGRHTATFTAVSALLAVGVTTGVLLQQEVTPTWAAWTDGVDVSGTTLGAGTVVTPPALNPPTVVTCLPGTGQKSVLSWSAVTGATQYRVHTGVATGSTYVTVSAPTTTQNLPNNQSGQTWVEAGNGTTWSAPSAKFNYVDALCTPVL
jgi:hypothetical protein